jgi:hypothetical protein
LKRHGFARENDGWRGPAFGFERLSQRMREHLAIRISDYDRDVNTKRLCRAARAVFGSCVVVETPNDLAGASVASVY